MKLKLSEWAHIAEIIGGVAVIASIIFVGVQIQENSRQVRSATFQAITDSDLDLVSQLVESPELQIAWLIDLEEPAMLTSEQSLGVDFYVIMLMRQMENVFQQYKAGVVSEERWLSSRAVVSFFITSKGGACWIRHSISYQQATRDFRDEVLNPLYEQNPWKDQELDCPFHIGTSISEF